MTNPSSRLTKFRLILEEYDFTVHYVKGSDNVTADALSRIQIESDLLKEMTCQSINVMTRAQSKVKKTEIKNGLTHEGTDHPGVVELLKPPENCAELQIIHRQELDAMLNKCRDKHNNKNVKVNENVHYNVSDNIIYLKQDTRSAFALDASLRDLKEVCEKFKIPELIILKNEQNAQILNKILRAPSRIKSLGIKISVIKGQKKLQVTK